MYKVSFGKITLPIAPSKITMKTRNNNKTMDLIDGSGINFLRSPGLTEYSFEFLIPHVKYPFAEYPDGFIPAQEYYEALEMMKGDKNPMHFIIQRILPNGTELFTTDMMVSLEDYSITEDTDNGLDFMASVTLKKFVEHKTGKFPIVQTTENAVMVKEEKQRDNKKEIPSTYTVKKGDSLWKICKAQMGDGAKYHEIAKLNGISNPNLIYPGQVIKFGTT